MCDGMLENARMKYKIAYMHCRYILYIDTYC